MILKFNTFDRAHGQRAQAVFAWVYSLFPHPRTDGFMPKSLARNSGQWLLTRSTPSVHDSKIRCRQSWFDLVN